MTDKLIGYNVKIMTSNIPFFTLKKYLMEELGFEKVKSEPSEIYDIIAFNPSTDYNTSYTVSRKIYKKFPDTIMQIECSPVYESKFSKLVRTLKK